MDCEFEAHRMKCVEVVARLVSQPQLGTVVMGMLEARDRTDNTEKEESTRWHSTYCYLDKISKDWCTEWMIKIAQSKGCPELNLDILNRVDMKDIGNIKRLFFLIAASPSTKLPRPCLDKLVCSSTLARRASQCGDRIKLVAACINAAGVVDWKRLGVYELTWQPGHIAEGACKRCTGITHRPSKETASIPSHIVIDTSFELCGNESDFESRVKKGVAEYRLCDFFGKQGAPWSVQLDKKGVALHELSLEEEDKIMKARAQVTDESLTGSSKALEVAVTKRRQEVAERARAKRAQGGGVKRQRTLVKFNSDASGVGLQGTS